MKKWKDLTFTERLAFTEEFYELWYKSGFGIDDVQENVHPWGMPWCCKADDIAMSAKEYFNLHKEEIKKEITTIEI